MVPALGEEGLRLRHLALHHAHAAMVHVLREKLGQELARGRGQLRGLDHGAIARGQGADEGGDGEVERICGRG